MNRYLLFTILSTSAFSTSGCKGEIHDNGHELVPCRGIPGPEEVCIPGGTFTMGHEPIKFSNNEIFNEV
jgi:hypothetical protein